MWTPSCPACGATDARELRYGLPSGGAFDGLSEREQELMFPGCCIFQDSPGWVCLKCEHTWGPRFEYMTTVEEAETEIANRSALPPGSLRLVLPGGRDAPAGLLMREFRAAWGAARPARKRR